MGKYMKKPKVTCQDATITDVGVRTRAKTLALQKQQQSDSSSSYLQLRSRRLQKILPAQKKVNSSKPNSGPVRADLEANSGEGSFGENDLEIQTRGGRSTRESTPCSYIRDPIRAETPGSATRPISSTGRNRRAQRISPTAEEIEDFLASAEKQQQRLFAEKYNFDVVNDVPLPGRYEWVRLEN